MAHHAIRTFITAAAVAASASLAEAHTSISGTAGFSHGFGHPFSGLDHILAMVAAGLFAARLGGKALWLVPSAFVAMMAVGGALGLSGIALPFVELGIAASVIVLGLAVALQWNLPVATAMGLAGFFAIFHGHAHGAEMPSSASGLDDALGFMLATALLHVIGIGLGLASGKSAEARSARLAQFAGGITAIAGIGILTGYV